MTDKLQEKCAIFGVIGKNAAASRLTYFGLYALQHRGQESSGIAASNGKEIRIHKSMGLVAQVYQESDFENLKGHIAIGQNRYSTSGGSTDEHNQPVGKKRDTVALAHNGNLPVVKKLKKFLLSIGVDVNGLNDSEMMHAAIKYYLVKGHSVEDAVKNIYPLFTGAFCILMMTKNKIVALRDCYGIRPLSIGQTPEGVYVFSSETCALTTVNAKYIRDVEPGEMVVATVNGISSEQLEPANQKLDIFEFVYFSRPDSMLLGKGVYQVRKNLGYELAKEYPINADVVIPVPDSAIPAAIGYSEAASIPFEFGLIKNRYIGRTFILPDQNLRDRGVQMKLHPLIEAIKNRRVVIIDDSIVRGTTAKKLVKLVRDAGAREVHLLSSCPPVRFPDFYGINTPSQKELIAANMTLGQIRKFVGAESVSYLSYEGMIRATGLPENVFCTSCFTGQYPIDIGLHAKKIKKLKITKQHIPTLHQIS